MKNSLWISVTRYQKLIIAAALVLAVAFPLIVKDQYIMRMAIVSLQFVMLTQSVNFLGGFLGQLSLGHIAFYGIGAYTCTILTMRAGFSAILAWPAAVIVSGIFGLILALPTLRLKGYYLAIVTLGFGEIMRIIEINWMSLTRGPLGILNIPPPDFFGFVIKTDREFFYLILILVILTTIIINRIVGSRIGRAIISIREDDIAAEAMGVNAFKYKTLTFVISAMIAGLSGAFFAQYTSYIDPSSFSSDQSTLLIIMALLGGMGSQVGPFIGAIVLSLLPEMIRGLMQYRMLIFGFIMLLIMQMRPNGLLGNVNFKYIRQNWMFEQPERNRDKVSKKGGEVNG